MKIIFAKFYHVNLVENILKKLMSKNLKGISKFLGDIIEIYRFKNHCLMTTVTEFVICVLLRIYDL